MLTIRSPTEAVPTIGAFAIILVSFVDTVAFFFVAELALRPFSRCLVCIGLAPFYLLAFVLRIVQTFFERISARPQASHPEDNSKIPTPHPVSSEPA